MLKLLHNNVFDVVADALLLTIDGQARGLRGNVAHAFQRRWPDAYEDFESRLRYEVIRRGAALRARRRCQGRLAEQGYP